MTHFLQRTALIALATGAFGACSTTDADLRPSYPVRSAETAPPAAEPALPPVAAPAATPPGEAPIASAPPPSVEQRPLEPLAPAAPSAVSPPPPPPPPPQPTYRTVTTRSVTGRVVDTEGAAATYQVRKGDNLEKIADKLGTTVRQLQQDNDIGRRATIHPGDVIKGPRRSAKAYVVAPGDTLFSIGRRFGVTADALREENDLADGANLRAGQKVRLPAGFRDKGPLTTTTRTLVSGASGPAVGDTAPEADESPTPRASTRASEPSEPSYRTVTSRSITGKVVEVSGRAETYTVKKGDNLEKIARKLDTTVAQLREDNDVGRRAIQPGQKLKGPRTTAKAYVAGSGDTLAGIGRRFGVTVEALRAENGLSRNAGVRSGQRVRLPDGYRDRGPITTTSRIPVAAPMPPLSPPPPPPRPATPPSPPITTTQPRPYVPPAPPPATPSTPQPYSPPERPYTPPGRTYTPPPRAYTPPPAAPTSSPPPSESQISELGRGRFVWPLQGHIISDFGPKGPGQRNDGINIASSLGTSVRSAAAGDVVYAGDQVPGFGNLVLIKHADGWVSAYGHLSKVMVRMQQKVTQGQEIGQTGATGGVAEPQLHFEIRYASSPLERAKPIDPKLVLPK